MTIAEQKKKDYSDRKERIIKAYGELPKPENVTFTVGYKDQTQEIKADFDKLEFGILRDCIISMLYKQLDQELTENNGNDQAKTSG